MADLSGVKEAQRKLWATGDYPAVVEWIRDAGKVAVERGQVSGDDTVLDVACGTGNATIPAAQLGATVTGLDLTPELLEVARAASKDAGLEIEWIEGDAENLPFDDESFDVVLSVFGSMFAPDHAKAASEIARVLKPGGRIAVCAWTPEGANGRMFITVGKHMPPPPEGFQPPVLWGTEDHVREIFDGTGMDLSFDSEDVEFEFDSPEHWESELTTKLSPVVVAKAALEPEGKWDALWSDLVAMREEVNTSDSGEVRYPAEYLVTTGTKSG